MTVRVVRGQESVLEPGAMGPPQFVAMMQKLFPHFWYSFAVGSIAAWLRCTHLVSQRHK